MAAWFYKKKINKKFSIPNLTGCGILTKSRKKESSPVKARSKKKMREILCLRIPQGAAHTSETNCLKHVEWNMKYLYDATNQYISMEERTLWNKKHIMFLEICFMKLINCVAWGNVTQLQTLLLCLSLIQMERIQQITWSMFP